MGNDSLQVCNRVTNTFQPSNPKEYTQWIKDRNGIVGNHSLRKVTRILKYMRDIKGNFTCPSFLLTTLIGLQIRPSDKGSDDFSDTPTALRTIMGRLDDWLSQRLPVPQVNNPVLYGENQSENWTASQYKNFCEKVQLYRTWIDEAFLEEDQEKSIRKWQDVLGDEFGVLQQVARKDSVAASSLGESAPISVTVDSVDLVRKFGVGAIGQELIRPKHLQDPKWRPASNLHDVRVSAELSFSTRRMKKQALEDGQILLPGHWVEFSASFAGGVPIEMAYRTEWRVTNNGPVAAKNNQLRGGFYSSNNGHARQEHLKYRGVHLVEAFVIRNYDDALIGQSRPFFVVVE